MSIETTVDCEIRYVVQFDEETGWHYFLNGVEISMEMSTMLKLPIQQPDEPEGKTLVQLAEEGTL